jgi:hypothetical protein
MREEDRKYFSEFLKEFQGETDRGAALVGGALIDSRLKRILSSHFLDNKTSKQLLEGANAPLGLLSSRLGLCYSLGMITELEYRECNYIRKIRNEFAHQEHGLKFTDSPVRDFAKNLKANTPDGNEFDGNTRQLFINSVVLTSLSLWYRPEYAEEYKAEKRNWKWQLIPEKK